MGVTETTRHEWTCDRCNKVEVVAVDDTPQDWTSHVDSDAVWCPGCSADRIQDRQVLRNVWDNLDAMTAAIRELTSEEPEADQLLNHLAEARKRAHTLLEAYR